MRRPIVLDFDGSVAPLDGTETIALRDHEENLRFACRLRALRDLPQTGDAPLVFLGSGDFHHVTYALLARLRRSVEVVVVDNHPDNMRYPFGIHCGSWVSHVAKLPFVARVHVLGITSSDVEGAHVIENGNGWREPIGALVQPVREHDHVESAIGIDPQRCSSEPRVPVRALAHVLTAARAARAGVPAECAPA